MFKSNTTPGVVKTPKSRAIQNLIGTIKGGPPKRMKVYCPILQTRLRGIFIKQRKIFFLLNQLFSSSMKKTHILKSRKKFFTFQRLMMRTPVSKVPIKVTPEKIIRN